MSELLLVLAEASVVAGAGDAPGEVWLGGPALRRSVHTAPAPTPGQLRELLLAAPGPGIVVADRLAERQRRVLDDAGWGWWDRRGSLAVRVGERQLRRTTVAVPVVEPTLPAPLVRATGRAVALHLLEAPARVPSVRTVASRLGASTGSVGRVLTELRELGHVERRRVVDPDQLLAAVAEGWRPRWHAVPVGLARTATAEQRHVIGLDGRAGGWRRVGAPAARALGAPAGPDPDAQGADAPEAGLRVLVPDERALAWLLRAADRGHDEVGGTTGPSGPSGPPLLAVGPCPAAAAGPVLPPTAGLADLPTAAPLEVALSLAAERGGSGPALLGAWRQQGWPLAW